MASVNRDGKGWRIRFTDGNGVRKTIRTGKLSKDAANAIGQRVAEIAVAKASGQPFTRQTALWLASIESQLYQKLVRAGLVGEQSFPPLEEFLDDFIARGRTSQRKPAAESTKKKWKAAKKRILEFFGAKEALRAITEKDAEAFRLWLEDQPVSDHTLAENTIRSVMAVTKMFFNAAKRMGHVDTNPFAGEVANTRENRSRDFYVKPEIARKIIDACPTSEWKLMVALWRFAGLRKTEIYHLRWSGVLWDSGKMLVTSPKTKIHEGKEERYVPIGDILFWLREVFELPGNSDRVITQYTDTNNNLDKPLKKILKDAGVLPWAKLFQNMRASCETDWLDRGHSAHVVANWIGHSIKIQVSNYAQVDEHHFQKFNTQSVAQNPAQQNLAPVSTGPPNGPQNTGKR